MALTDSQIDRYSRQIIVPDIGGRGQENLLRARLLMAGDFGDLELTLAYMAGAGVGAIFLRPCALNGQDLRRFAGTIANLKHLNPDSNVSMAEGSRAGADTAIFLIGSTQALELARARTGPEAASIIVRLDAPGLIATISAKAQRGGALQILRDPFGKRAENADFMAMAAAAAALKLMAKRDVAPAPTLIRFNGYESESTPIIE